ncbi:ovomucoid-like [Vicugna pacos]|uniref:Ovomucoid-like n=1 Tax=Vicugna pacos TaxID=30538 RepID=A0ABM5CC52_VICPA
MKTFFVAVLAFGYFTHIFFANNPGNTDYEELSCSYYQKKSVQRKRVCSIRVSLLCASNNVTYPNYCVYCFANIALNLTLEVQHSGKCRKTETPET